MNPRIIAITDCDHATINEELAVFQSQSIKCKLFQCKTETDLISSIADYPVVLNQYAPFTRQVFASLPNLRLIVRYGVGVNNIDLEAANDHSVIVCNVPDYGTQEVAAHALALSLALLRKVSLLNESVHKAEWDYTKSIPIRRLKDLTFGIVGIGRIGSAYLEMIKPFGGRIITTEISNRSTPKGVEMVTFETLLSESDIISIHTNLETSRNLFNLESFRQMKNSSYLINVSRGGIVNEKDLAYALREGLIAGAALDVIENEPIDKNSSLIDCPNLLLTPHVAWYSEEASSDLKTKTAEEAARFINNEPLKNIVNL